MLTRAQPSFLGSGRAQRAVRNLHIKRVDFVGTAAAEISWCVWVEKQSGSYRSNLMKCDGATSWAKPIWIEYADRSPGEVAYLC